MTDAEVDASTSELRVLTFNLLALQHRDGQRRLEVARPGVRELQPDVVAFQEVTRTTAYDQALDLLGDGYETVSHPGSSADGVGACLTSRWPLGAVNTVDPHVRPAAVGLPWAATVAIEVLAPPPLGPLLVVHHKPDWQYGQELGREQQAVTAARFVERLIADEDRRVVLVGDFDAAPDSASIRFWTGRQSLSGTSVAYQDAWEAAHPLDPGHTFTPRNPLVRDGEMPLEQGRRIDYVMVRCGPQGPALAVRHCTLAFDEPDGDVWASDHFGVVADLAMPSRAVGAWA